MKPSVIHVRYMYSTGRLLNIKAWKQVCTNRVLFNYLYCLYLVRSILMLSINRLFLPFCIPLLLLLAGTAAAQQQFSVAQLPDPMLHNSHISNPDKLISAATEQALEQLLDSLHHSGRAQVAVVLLNTIGDKVPKDLAHELFRTWKPGNREKDNGLLVLLVKDQHRIEFETGYGLEGDLPDVICFRIQQKIMLPFFKQENYDAGILQGLQAVADVLRGQAPSAAAGNSEDQPPADLETEAPQRKVPGDLAIVLYFGFFLIGNIGFIILFRRKRSRTDASTPPVLYRPGWGAWIWLFIVPFVIIFCLTNFSTLSFGAFTVALIIYADWILFWCWYVGVFSMRATRSTANSDRYHQFLIWKTAEQGLLLAILFPLPMLFFSRRVGKRLYQLRSAPYPCDSCGKPMDRLSEKADDAHLEKYQLIEEKIGSVDYDVWHCGACSTQRVYAYDISSSDATACPQCRHKTLTPARQEIQQAATTSSAGWGWQYYDCGFCDFRKKETYAIPATGSSSDSSSGFSSSSGSSSDSSDSWGGGDSGGGGSGSSW